MNQPRILIIDDSKAIRLAVRSTLSRAGFDVIEARDGEQGREIITSQSDISLVLCDVNMPRLNGLSMVELIKADPSHAELPVVMLTTEGEPAMVRRARAAGARGWIVKPFKDDVLVATVRRLAQAGCEQAAK
ncbi:MAG: response regulator [Oligoflexia bacterium]|nr:response regulator [Oligoflexia bacterium]